MPAAEIGRLRENEILLLAPFTLARQDVLDDRLSRIGTRPRNWLFLSSRRSSQFESGAGLGGFTPRSGCRGGERFQSGLFHTMSCFGIRGRGFSQWQGQ